jgi:beta-glucanase (GH16 family)
VNATKFAEYLTNFHDTFQRPIWVTEWACQNFNKGPQCSADDVVRFLDSTQSFMDQQDWVERYSWFGAMRDLQGVNTANALEDKDGHITDLGKQYIGLEGPKTNGGPQTSGAPPTKTTGAGGLPGLPTSGVLGRGRGAWGALWPALFILALL